MSAQGSGATSCASTGLAVPECSCRRCLEEMLHRFRPELLSDEIRVTRTAQQGDRPNVQPDHPG